jgi:tetratricopeptide (TPR) repeat protein
MAALNQDNPQSSEARSDGTPLGPYKDTPICLFIVDPVLLKQTYTALSGLGFSQVNIAKVHPQYFQAMQQLYGDLRQFEGLMLVNHPARKVTDNSGRQYDDRGFKDFFAGVASLAEKGNRNPSELLSKCVPIFTAPQDHDIRTRFIEDLFPFGIVGAFMLSVLDYHAKWDQQVEERTGELHAYLLEYFQQRNNKLSELKEYKSAEELRERRAKADQIQAEVEKLKEAKDYDKAIALCRQMIEVLPTDPGPYMESGRLLVKKKRYPPAMQMFNDASKVAEDLPAPNQEIGNCRVEQAKDYIQKKKAMGQKPDQAVLEEFFSDALENFGAALEKAKVTVALRKDDQEVKRQDAVASIAENLLTLELEEVLGPEHPVVSKLGKLAHDNLKDQVSGEGGLPTKYMIQFGLSEMHAGNFSEAERLFFRAAADPIQRDSACVRINYLGTTLRRQDHLDRAVSVYRKLLDLKPAFKGVVIFNLGVALKAKADKLARSKPAEAAKFEHEAVGCVIQAIYIDPGLPAEDNFYQNNIVAPTMRKADALFKAAARQADECEEASSHIEADDPDAKACIKAREELEALLEAGKQREALGYLFNLAQTTQSFFLKFDKFASRPIQDFAASIEPRLRDNPKPQMRTFGKVLAVLVQRGKSAAPAVEDNDDNEMTGHPMLDKVMQFMMQGQQDMAAKALTQALYSQPELMRDTRCAGHDSISNLCREINQKLGGVDFSRFKVAGA